jgi:hypothetical protein
VDECLDLVKSANGRQSVVVVPQPARLCSHGSVKLGLERPDVFLTLGFRHIESSDDGHLLLKKATSALNGCRDAPWAQF